MTYYSDIIPINVQVALDVYIQRVFPCRTKEGGSCDSYGVCDNCCDSALIKAGAEITIKALKEANESKNT